MFDPTKPLDGAHATAAALRDQFNGLKALIDAVPAGPPGPPFANIQIAGVTTGDPGTSAAVGVAVFGANVELSFTIPRGDAGAAGEVSAAALAQSLVDERLNHAKNPTAIPPLALVISDPPTQAEVQELVNRYNALLAELTRQP